MRRGLRVREESNTIRKGAARLQSFERPLSGDLPTVAEWRLLAVFCRCRIAPDPRDLGQAPVERRRRHAAARSGPHCRQRQRIPHSAGTRLSDVSSWPQRVGAKTLPDGRF